MTRKGALLRSQVPVVKRSQHAIGREGVQQTVIVHIHQPSGPGPVRGGEAREESNLGEAIRIQAEQQRVFQILMSFAIRVDLVDVIVVADRTQVMLPLHRCHVSHPEIDLPIVVDIAEIRPHRIVGNMRSDFRQYIHKGTVSII